MRRFSALVALLVATIPSTLPAQVGVPVSERPVTDRSVPTPASVIGFAPGTDFRLADYEQSVAYFQALAEASDRIRLMQVGTTSLGRPWMLAVISSPANLARLEELREAAQQLAHPASLDEDGARAMIRGQPAFVDISGGLHASEVAGAQQQIQLAYDLLARPDDPEVEAILDHVVLFLWPSLNPDGQDIVAHWYRENVGTPYEVAPLHELYQKYVGHDNNRDAYMLNTVENRVVERTWRHFEPQLIHVHHQSSPFPTRIWLPPFAEPIAPRVPPRMSREANTVGMAIAERLDTEGRPGATHMGTGFDAWYPGYIDYMPMLQNQVAFWTETALYRYATPYFYTMDDFPPAMRDLRPEPLYASPWEGGWWRLGDAVGYMETASMADLRYAVEARERLLWNRYVAGREAIERYTNHPPYAYVVPQEQRDPMAAVALLRRLAFNGVRVSRLARGARLDGEAWPAGTWVIPMDQEFSELARQVLEVQDYPDLREFPGGPPEQPYDAAGWTLPFQMGVRVVEARVPLDPAFRAALEPVRGEPVDWNDVAGAPFATDSVAAGIVPPPGRVTGSGGRVALDPAQNESFSLLNEALAHGAAVGWLPPAGSRGGRWVVSGVAGSTLSRWVDERGVPARLRAAMYRPWTASMDEGWSRWLFDRYGFAVDTVTNADLHAGGLRERYDVIVLPSESPRRLLEGWAKGTVPPRWEGGIGAEGVRQLDAFVRAGGTLVALSSAADLAIEQLHLPVENVVDTLSRRAFFAGGSILRVETDPAHPVMAGMPTRAYVFFDGSPVFTTKDGFEGVALAKYQESGSPLASGYLLGEEHLQGYAAALDVKHGEGHVVLIGFRPQWRGQPFGTFRVLLNALLYGGEVAARTVGTPGFWAAPGVPPS